MSVPKRNDHADALGELLDVIDALLAPDGCPWDREQTPRSMCDYLAEEAFELIEAIRADDVVEAREELGDVLFILLFIAAKYQSRDAFTLSDSLRRSATKMIRRHPHVFADTNFDDREALMDNWEQTKKLENKDVGRKGVFDSLPKGLPPLLKAYRINSKAARNRFTWQSDDGVEAQLRDEWREWRDALKSGDAQASEREFGDYLFTLVELGRRKGIKANAALDFANQKFLARFGRMEALAEDKGMAFDELDLHAMNALWDEVKKSEED